MEKISEIGSNRIIMKLQAKTITKGLSLASNTSVPTGLLNGVILLSDFIFDLTGFG